MATATVSTSSEKEFASSYLTLLSLGETKFPSDYKKDLKDVRGLGVKLPNLPIAKKSDSSKHSAISNATLHDCVFKSIKEPKFNVTLQVKSTDTIYQVKTDLCKSVQADVGSLEPSQIKLLLKGKVIHDSSLISDIAQDDSSEVKFTAIVGTPSTTPAQVSTPEPEESTEVAIPWNEIEQLLKSKGIDSKAIIQRLQDGWELTK